MLGKKLMSSGKNMQKETQFCLESFTVFPPHLQDLPEELRGDLPAPELWRDVEVLDDGDGVGLGGRVLTHRGGAVGVQRVEEEHVADQRTTRLLLRHEALEVRRVGVDQGLQRVQKEGKVTKSLVQTGLGKSSSFEELSSF